ncbi:MAG: ABC transporter substrate-binding protein [Nitrososphaeria archaeon]
MRSRRLAIIISILLLSIITLPLLYNQYHVKPANEINVVFLSHYLAPDAIAFKNLIERWNPSFQKMGFYVNVIDFDKESILPTILSSKNSSIDMIVVTNFNFKEILPYLLPLNLSLTEQFYEKAVRTFYSNGSLYALPFHTSFPILVYNKNYIIEPPKSFNQLILIAKNFSKACNPNSPTEYGLAIYSLEGRHSSLVFQSLYENLGGQTLATNSTIKFLSNETIESLLDTYSFLMKEKISPPEVIYLESSVLDDEFIAERFPIMIQWNYAVHTLSNRGMENIGIAPIPSNSMSSNSVGYLMAFGICKSSKNVHLSIKFLEELYEPNFLKGLIETGFFPPIKGSSKIFESNILDFEEKIFYNSYKNCFNEKFSNKFYETFSKYLAWYLEKRVSEKEFTKLISSIS